MEMNEEEEEKLNILLMVFLKNRNIKIPEDSNMLIDACYYDVIQNIETYLEVIKNDK